MKQVSLSCKYNHMASKTTEMRLESKNDYHKSIIHLWGTVTSTAQGIFKLTIKYDEPLNVDLGTYAKILKGKNPQL